MKKTIIALIALAGIAAGDVDTDIQKALTDMGYKEGDSFDITLTFNGAWSGLTTSDGLLTLKTQTYGSDTQYVKVGDGNASWGSGWVFDTTSFTESTSTTLSLTVSKDNAAGQWITPTVGVNNSGNYEVKNGEIADAINTFTISYDAVSDSTALIATRDFTANAGGGAYTGTYYVTSEYIITGLTLNATKLNISNGGVGSVTVKVIPEPTTATLSLLALAGLAAHRRRR